MERAFVPFVYFAVRKVAHLNLTLIESKVQVVAEIELNYMCSIIIELIINHLLVWNIINSSETIYYKPIYLRNYRYVGGKQSEKRIIMWEWK